MRLRAERDKVAATQAGTKVRVGLAFADKTGRACGRKQRLATSCTAKCLSPIANRE